MLHVHCRLLQQFHYTHQNATTFPKLSMIFINSIIFPGLQIVIVKFHDLFQVFHDHGNPELENRLGRYHGITVYWETEISRWYDFEYRHKYGGSSFYLLKHGATAFFLLLSDAFPKYLNFWTLSKFVWFL